MRKLTILSISIALVFGLSFSTSAMASDEDEVLQVVEKFCEAIYTNNFELVSSLWWHSPKASSFEPGGVPFLIQGWDGVETWWRSNFSGTTEETTPGSIYNPQVTMLSDDMAYTTAYHVQTSTDTVTQNSTTEIIRESLFIQKINNKWLIVHAHASSLRSD